MAHCMEKKRSLDQTNINSKPVAPAPMISLPSPISTEPVIQNVVQHVEGILQVQGVLPSSDPQHISITTESILRPITHDHKRPCSS